MIISIILLTGDTAYSFASHFYEPLDGDYAPGVLAKNGIDEILRDPFELSVFFDNARYINPNKFFCHFFTVKFFVPFTLFIQNFCDPIDSIYLACAIFKTFIQLGIIFLLSGMIMKVLKISCKFLPLITLLIAPFFHAGGYNQTIGIIDHSAAYTVFYATPVFLLLVFFYSELHYLFRNEKPPFFIRILQALLIVVLPFSGPLIPGIVLVASLIGVFYFMVWLYNINRSFMSFFDGPIILYFIILNLLCIYSLYIGRNNSLNETGIDISERYNLMLKGLVDWVTLNSAVLIIVLLLIVEGVIISKFLSPLIRSKMFIVWFLLVFCCVYILMLPLGGYRAYRPNIIRYDTMIPVTLSLVFLFSFLATLIFKEWKLYRMHFSVGVLLVLTVFTWKDDFQMGKNNCERKALQFISSSPKDTVFVDVDCRILAWDATYKPEQSLLNSELLVKLNVFDKQKLFYQKEIYR